MGEQPYITIVLNGTSSSGKTSVARALQEQLKEVWLNFSIDSVLYSLPSSVLKRMISGDAINHAGYNYSTLDNGYWHSVAALVREGNRVIADNGLIQPAQKKKVRKLLGERQCLWVGIHCDLSELRKRELARGDRALGTAENELATVHQGMRYDLEFDTCSMTSERIAKVIADKVQLVPGTS